MYVGVLVILQSPRKDDSFSQFIPFVQNVRQMEKMKVLVVHALLGKKGKTILIKHIYIQIKHSFQYFKIIFNLFL